jgi:prepilin-type N-terminal cleavage/methylation domain-containing protein
MNLPSHSPAHRRQGGFGLLEIIIAAAIVAVLSVAIFARAKTAKNASAITQTMDDLAHIGSKVSARFQATTAGNYTELGTTLSALTGMGLARPLPDDMPVNRNPTTNAITNYGNRFGGALSLRARSIDGGTNNAMGFFLTQVPKDACDDLLNSASTSFGIIDVYADATSGTPTVLRSGYGAAPPTKTAIAGFCDALAANFSVEFVVR